MIQILKEHTPIQKPDLILLDFDGTISKLRTGWYDVMRDLMVDYIPGDKEQVKKEAEAFIDESTGIPTIRQMQWLAKQVAARGEQAMEAWEYKKEFAARLRNTIEQRKQSIVNGEKPAEYYLVPGSVEFLKAVKEKGIPIYLASGTDDADVRSEAAALGVLDYFDVIMGADPYADMCAKEEVLKKLIRPGLKMLVVGDGKVEIRLGAEAGAVTLGVASWDEYENFGPGLEPVKERRLINAGAHALVADFTDCNEILNWL